MRRPTEATRASEAHGFDRRNVFELPSESRRAHGGRGLIEFVRAARASELAGACNFIDYALLPPGTSIGEHRHRDDEEEFYLVLSGNGRLRREGVEFRVRAG